MCQKMGMIDYSSSSLVCLMLATFYTFFLLQSDLRPCFGFVGLCVYLSSRHLGSLLDFCPIFYIPLLLFSVYYPFRDVVVFMDEQPPSRLIEVREEFVGPLPSTVVN